MKFMYTTPIRRQQGQALAETVVICLYALVPFFIVIPLIGKYQDIRQSTLASARTAGFECSVHFERCQQGQGSDTIANQLRLRHFSQHRLGVRSDDVADDSQLTQNGNVLWVDGRGRPLLDSYKKVTVQVAPEQFDAFDSSRNNAVTDDLLQGGSKFAGPDAFGLPIKSGLMGATVNAEIRIDEKLADWLPKKSASVFNFQERSVLMTDSWNASSAKGSERRSFKNRVDLGWRLPIGRKATGLSQAMQRLDSGNLLGRYDGGDLETVQQALTQPIRQLMDIDDRIMNGSNSQRFKYHEYDVEIVPPDRLKETSQRQRGGHHAGHRREGR